MSHNSQPPYFAIVAPTISGGYNLCDMLLLLIKTQRHKHLPAELLYMPALHRIHVVAPVAHNRGCIITPADDPIHWTLKLRVSNKQLNFKVAMLLPLYGVLPDHIQFFPVLCQLAV